MRPNVIIFNPDQMRCDALHHMGNQASVTPNLDAIVREDAVSFRNAFCQNTVCVPSRCSFLTGWYPHVRGHRSMNYMLHNEESSLLKELKNAGYYVWMNGRNDFLPAQHEQSFYEHADTVFYNGERAQQPVPVVKDIKGNYGDSQYFSFYKGELETDKNGKFYSGDDEDVDEAIRTIRNRPKDQPFCLFIGLMAPHPPYQVEAPYFDAIDPAKLPPRISVPKDLENRPLMYQKILKNFNMNAYTEDEWNHLRACYLGMCMKVDEQFGRICQALKEEGLYDETDLYFLSDHGDFTGDYGIPEKAQNLMPDCLVNVPLIIKPHKTVQTDAGISDSMVELVDFYATVMDLCGVTPDHVHFGKSLSPVLKNRSHKNRPYVFCEGGRLPQERDAYKEIDDAHLTPDFDYYPRVSVQNDDQAHNKATMIRDQRYKYILRRTEKDEFYDLETDPREHHNKIDDPSVQKIILDMKQKMLNWYQDTCDCVMLHQDARLGAEALWNKIQKYCPPEKREELREKLRQLLEKEDAASCFAKIFEILSKPDNSN